MRSKRSKGAVDKKYLEFIRSLPCSLCTKNGAKQDTRTEAAHTGPRGLSQKADDRTAIPLCAWCHREGPASHHKLGKNFWSHWRMDQTVVISTLYAQYLEEV